MDLMPECSLIFCCARVFSKHCLHCFFQFVVTPSIRNNVMPIAILFLPIVDTIYQLEAPDIWLHLALDVNKGSQLQLIQCLIAQVNEAFNYNSHCNTKHAVSEQALLCKTFRHRQVTGMSVIMKHPLVEIKRAIIKSSLPLPPWITLDQLRNISWWRSTFPTWGTRSSRMFNTFHIPRIFCTNTWSVTKGIL